MNLSAQRLRSSIYRRIREFFIKRGYLEVETPVLSPLIIPESSIEVFATELIHPFAGRQSLYLVPSPEIYMKQLLAAGSGSIFQISKCFRNSEQSGRIHNPEFSMLEWYSVDADYHDSIACTEELFRAVADSDTPEHLLPPFRVMTMHEACSRYAGVDLDSVQRIDTLAAAVEASGLHHSREPESWEALFNRLFLTLVEPELPQDRPLILTDYPARIRCLAAGKPGTPYKARWELYAGGVELANCYTEEDDPERIDAYLRAEQADVAALRNQTGGVLPDSPPDYRNLFNTPEGTFPPSSGVALGLDRLIMLLGGYSSLEGVILFPHSAII